MPALPPVPQVLKFRFIGTDAADHSIGSHIWIHYSGTAPTATQLNTLASNSSAVWNTDLAPLTPTAFTLNEITIADLSTATSAQGSWTGSVAGTRAGTGLSLGTAFTINYQTTLRRRGGRWHGQWYWGVTGDLATTQTWTSAFVASALADFPGLIGGINGFVWSGGGVLTHVGVQYYGPPNRTVTGSTGRVRTISTLLAAPVVYPITGYQAFTRLGSQRRRLGKSGT